MSLPRRYLPWLLALSLVAAPSVSHVAALEETAGGTIFLPLVTRNYNPIAGLRTVNLPYVPDLIGSNPEPPPSWRIARLSDMSIFWFGKITDAENYVDVRVAYTESELVVYVAVIDRYVRYDPMPVANALLNWDAVSVAVSLGGRVPAPDTTTYRFDLQYGGGTGVTHQAAFRGNGSGWSQVSIPFTTFSSDRWEDLVNGSTSKGWSAMMRIPFSSLGIVGRPADGTVWGLSVYNRDRDSQSNPAVVEKTWPEAADRGAPSTWGRMRFGLPTYSAPYAPADTVTIRHGLNGADVQDANVGGYTSCGSLAESDYWGLWGILTWSDYWSGRTDFSVQNQSDISDWPCFAKYYIRFPLASIPPNKVIRSARFVLNHWSNPDGPRSLIQVSTVAGEWSAPTLNWNNAPMPLENVSRAWVESFPPGSTNFPGTAYAFDVSGAVAAAYASGQQSLSLAVYSADAAMSSGKYFIASRSDYQTERPRLLISWDNP